MAKEIELEDILTVTPLARPAEFAGCTVMLHFPDEGLFRQQWPELVAEYTELYDKWHWKYRQNVAPVTLAAMIGDTGDTVTAEGLDFCIEDLEDFLADLTDTGTEITITAKE